MLLQAGSCMVGWAHDPGRSLHSMARSVFRVQGREKSMPPVAGLLHLCLALLHETTVPDKDLFAFSPAPLMARRAELCKEAFCSGLQRAG